MLTIIASSITNPGKFIEFPIVLTEQVMNFCALIMQQSFQFASSILRLMV